MAVRAPNKSVVARNAPANFPLRVAGGIGALLLLAACACALGDPPPAADAPPVSADTAQSPATQPTTQPPEAPTQEEALAHLLKIHQETSATCALPDPQDYTVKYYTGISGSFHRIMIKGYSDSADCTSRPATGFYHEFLYGKDGRLAFIVAHQADDKRYVTDQILYHKDGPYARLSYSATGLSYGDYVYYANGRPFLACRVVGDREVLVELVKE